MSLFNLLPKPSVLISGKWKTEVQRGQVHTVSGPLTLASSTLGIHLVLAVGLGGRCGAGAEEPPRRGALDIGPLSSGP